MDTSGSTLRETEDERVRDLAVAESRDTSMTVERRDLPGAEQPGPHAVMPLMRVGQFRKLGTALSWMPRLGRCG